MKYLAIVLISFAAVGSIGVLCAYLINRQVNSYSIDKILQRVGDIQDEEPPRIAIVYGAAVFKNG
ncbi:MAG: hypothetical protein KDB79_12695, partial [Acidobacteria bacterium]|nr:hypothetical protein [Acidobacteriota bacterium]